MTHPSGQSAADPVIGGFAFWRKNPFLASSMVPIMMTLVDGRFTGTDPQGGIVFDAPAAQVSGRFGSMGTLKITVAGRRFAIVGRGSIGGMESGFSKGQLQYLQEFFERFPQATSAQADPTAVSFGPPVAKLEVWRDGLTAAGGSVR